MTGGGRDSTLCELAGSLIVRTNRYAEELLPYFFDSLPRFRESESIGYELGLSTLREVHTELLRVLASDAEPRSAHIGSSSLLWARTMAAEDIPLQVAERGYRLASSWLWTRWLDDIDGLDLELELSHIRTSSAAVFGGFESIAEQFATEYGRARRRTTTPTAPLTAALRVALRSDTGTDRATEILDRLGYPTDGHHLCVVVRAGRRGSRPGAVAQELARGLLRSAVSVLRSGELEQGHCVWLGGDADLLDDHLGRLEAWLPGDGELVGIGRVRPGPTGFRDTLGEAATALTLRSRYHFTSAVVSYRRVDVIAALAPRAAEARTLLRDHLGELADPGASARQLRETLLAFLRAGGSWKQAAADLGVHRNTVAYRIERAEEIIGPVSDRRVELSALLLLARAFDGAGP